MYIFAEINIIDSIDICTKIIMQLHVLTAHYFEYMAKQLQSAAMTIFKQITIGIDRSTYVARVVSSVV